MIDAVGLARLAEEQAERAELEDTRPFGPVTSNEVNGWVEELLAGTRTKLPYPLLPLEHLKRITGEKWEVLGRSIFHDITGYDLRDAGGPASSIIGMLREVELLLHEHGPAYLILHDAYQFQGYTSVVRPVSE